MRVLSLFLVLAAALATPALAQTPPPESEVESIVVEGSRPTLREIVTETRTFIQDIGGAPRGNNMARWDDHDTICVGVVNLAQPHAQRLADRVSEMAASVGLTPGEPGCRANLLILADSDGDALAQQLVDQEPRIFRPDLDDTNLGRAALRRFQTSGAPVRWWHITFAANPFTGAVIPDGSRVGVEGASRIRDNVEQEVTWAIVILDTSRIGRVNFEALADYVALVSLAQFDDRADTSGYDTVLNLFQPTSTGDLRLSRWDEDFLHGLYAARGDGARTFQGTEIGYAIEDRYERREREISED